MVDLLFDPRRHFYFYGVKFVNLDLIEQMKVLRGEKKDTQDIRLIKSWRYSDAHWKMHLIICRLRRGFPKYKQRLLRQKIRRMKNRLFSLVKSK